MGMLPIISLQLLTLFNIEFKKLALLLVPLQVVFIIIEWVNLGPLMAFIVLEASTFLNGIIFLAWRFYQRQVSQLVKTQHLLDELQLTYTEVKEISQQNERNRIGRDLHDTLMQGLAGVTMQLEGIKSLMASDKNERASEEIEKTISLSRTTLKEAREIVFDMRKDNSKNINLYDRLELLSKVFYENYGLSVRIKSTSDMRVSEDVYEEVSRIISESLTNVVRHSKTDVAIVKIDMDDQLRISIIDYGVGFNVENGKRKHKHFGLKSIQERVEQLEGKLLVKSHIGEGTEIQIQIPTKLRWQNDQ
ncbi:sensor histidine kinase, partial [Leuconostoc suionicum]